MSLDFKQLGPLFSLSRDAVLGLEGDRVVFCNPAAEALLALHPGDTVSPLLPEELWTAEDGHYISALPLGDGVADYALLRAGDCRLLTLYPRQSLRDSAPSGSLRVFADSLATARMALDALQARLAGEAGADRRYTTILYRQLYTLQRLYSHLTLTENLQNGSHPLALRSINLEELFGELCRSVRLLVAEKQSCKLHFTAAPGLYVTAADPELMELMLLNLLSNSLLHGRSKNIHISLQTQGERFVLSLDDDGAGLDPEALPQLFTGEPELSQAHRGAGLGLRIARGIAELHGGRLILESRPDKGCSLRVLLPKAGGDELSLRMPHPRYGSEGLQRILTELAPLLPDEAFTQKYSD